MYIITTRAVNGMDAVRCCNNDKTTILIIKKEVSSIKYTQYKICLRIGLVLYSTYKEERTHTNQWLVWSSCGVNEGTNIFSNMPKTN